MKNYSWSYGIFHWLIHYVITIALLAVANITILPASLSIPFSSLGLPFTGNFLDVLLVIIISSLIDLDHIEFLKKFGFKKYVWAEKRLIAPLHNFFFLSVLSIASASAALFVSKAAGVILFSVVLHVIWDIFEDVVIFRTSFRRWEKTWGLNTKDLEDAYNELLQYEAQQPKKESRISRVKKIGSKLKEKIKKKNNPSAVSMGLS